jgi:hypothetical protein
VEPGEASGGSAVGAGEAAGVQESCFLDDFVAGDVGVPVQEQIDSWFWERWRDVDEPDLPAGDLEVQGEGPMPGRIAVAPHDADRDPERDQRSERFEFAYVSQMPDLLGTLEHFGKVGRKAIVCVGYYGDWHDGIR